MGRKKRFDPNQQMFNFGPALNIGSVVINQTSAAKEDGNSHELSSFEFGLHKVLKMVLDDASKRERDPLDRIEIASRMSKKLGREITKSHIDGWVAMSAVERRIHVDSMFALSVVTNDFRAMHYFCESCGFKALSPSKAALADYGAKTALMEKLKTETKNLKERFDDPRLLEELVGSLGKGE